MVRRAPLGRQQVAWWRVRALVGAAAVLVLAAGCGSSRSSSSAGKSHSAAPAASVQQPVVNLIPNASFEKEGDERGVAADVSFWGAVHLSLVTARVVNGHYAQRLVVPAGEEGGLFFQVPALPNTAYTQSLYLDVISLVPAAQVAMILEWYDTSLRLITYQMYPIDRTGLGMVRVVQTARSPGNAAVVRFVVNIAGGGEVVMDAAQLEKGLKANPFTLPGPQAVAVPVPVPTTLRPVATTVKPATSPTTAKRSTSTTIAAAG